jgi:hypothetical protein
MRPRKYRAPDKQCVFAFFTLWKRVKTHVLSDQSVHITHTYCCVSKLWCLERQAFGTPRKYTLSPSKSIKGSNYGDFLKDKHVLLCTRLYKYAPNLESLLTQQYVCVMCTLWSDNTVCTDRDLTYTKCTPSNKIVHPHLYAWYIHIKKNVLFITIVFNFIKLTENYFSTLVLWSYDHLKVDFTSVTTIDIKMTLKWLTTLE